jgi:hypothetical protein
VPQKVQAVERTSEPSFNSSAGTENERKQSVQVITKYRASTSGIQTGALSQKVMKLKHDSPEFKPAIEELKSALHEYLMDTRAKVSDFRRAVGRLQ